MFRKSSRFIYIVHLFETRENIRVLKDKYELEVDINRIDKFQNNRLKAYGYWLISKNLAKISKINSAFDFETKSHNFLKLSSEDISDKYLRENFINDVFLHKIIMTETSISFDNLFDDGQNIKDEELENIIDFKAFNYCINCGQENIDEGSRCQGCDTILVEEYYNN